MLIASHPAQQEQLNGKSESVALLSFCVIAIGSVSCVIAGVVAVRKNLCGAQFPAPGIIALLALLCSGCCCLLAPFYKSFSKAGFVVYVLVWGAAVVADSAQFSTLCAQSAPKEYVGTALTLSTTMGYMITLVSVNLLGTMLSSGVEPGWAMLTLCIGPVLASINCYRAWPLHKLLQRPKQQTTDTSHSEASFQGSQNP